MRSFIFRQVQDTELEDVLLLLQDADEDQERVRTLVTDGRHTSYVAFDGQAMIGAATVYWNGEKSEIEYIAVVAGKRGQGYGTRLMAALVEEGRKQHIPALLIGTDNTAFDNIAFYQKCGFRMYSVRRDFFAYIQPPIVHDGILLRDMLVLRYDYYNSEQAPSRG